MAKPLVVVMGVSGSGKTTIGTLLAAALDVPFIDGDALHSVANVAKMSRGIPLTDEDRWPWLAAVGQRLMAATGDGLVIACSALKREYRDAIRLEAPDAVFVELVGSHALLEDRLEERKDHFMPPELLDSQLATLESLAPDERGMILDVAKPAPAVVDEAIAGLRHLAA